MARENGWILIGLLDLAEAAAQPQLAAREFWTKVPFAGSEVMVPAFPFGTSESQPVTRGPAPAAGADTDAVLAELGLGPDDLAELRRAEVI